MGWAFAGAAIALVVVVAAVMYFTVLTVGFSLDGAALRMSSGTTVDQLVAQKLRARHAGNLVAAKDHRVLGAGQGSAPYVTRDGVPVPTDARLTASWQLTSHDGTDVVEPTREVTESIPVPTRYVGDGPVETLVKDGTPGVRRIITGVISHQVVSKREIMPAIAKVVRREAMYSGAKVVALTFDDGPWPGSTEKILGILKKYNVKATFFEIGRQARQMPGLSRAVANAGMEMGNHSETHPLSLAKLSSSAVAKEIIQAQNDIYHASGKGPKFFRPPGGNTTPAMYAPLTKLHMSWLEWDIDTDDWKRPSPGAIVSRVISNVRPGSVVLMHDGGGDRSRTVQALPTIIQKLKSMGYTFVTVSQLSSVPHRMG